MMLLIHLTKRQTACSCHLGTCTGPDSGHFHSWYRECRIRYCDILILLTHEYCWHTQNSERSQASFSALIDVSLIKSLSYNLKAADAMLHGNKRQSRNTPKTWKNADP